MELLLISIEALGLLQKHVLDGVVEEELAAEIAQLLAQELVQLFHDGGQDADTMGANGVEHLVDADGAHLLRLLRFLDEHLLVQVVSVVAYEGICLLEQKHDIDALVELLRGQVRRHHFDSELVVGE